MPSLTDSENDEDEDPFPSGRTDNEVKEILDAIINNVAGGAAQTGSEEMMLQVIKNEEAKVFICVKIFIYISQNLTL